MPSVNASISDKLFAVLLVGVIVVACLVGSISYNSKEEETKSCCSIVDVSECRGPHCWLHQLPEKVGLDVLFSELGSLERYLDEFKQCICKPNADTLAAWNYTRFFLNRIRYVAEEMANK